MWIPESSVVTSTVSTSSTSPQRSNEHVTVTSTLSSKVEIEIHQETPGTPPPEYANITPLTTIITTSSSIDTITGETGNLSLLSGPASPSNLSSVTLVGSTGDQDRDLTPTANENPFQYGRAPSSPVPERKRKQGESGDAAREKQEPAADRKRNGMHEIKIEPAKSERGETSAASTKPTIVSTIAKSPLASFSNGRTLSPSPNRSGGLQPNMSYLTMNRRPSAGANVIPVAALTQHRRSLQLNASDLGFSGNRVKREVSFGIPAASTDFFPQSAERSSPRSSRRFSKTPEKHRKSIFGTPQKEKDTPRYVQCKRCFFPPSKVNQSKRTTCRRFSESDDDMANTSFYTTPRGSVGGSSYGTISPRASIQQDPVAHCNSKVGVVITSYRQSHRR